MLINPYRYAAAGLWLPTDLVNLELWLDAMDTGTVTLSGGDVTAWADKSGNSRDAAGTTSNEPSYVSGQYVAMNGGESIEVPWNNTIATTCNIFSVQEITDTSFFAHIVNGAATSWTLIGRVGNTSTAVTGNFGTPAFYKNGSVETIVDRDDAGLAYEGNKCLLGQVGGEMSDSSWNSNLVVNNASYASDIDQYELIIVSGTISTANRQRVEGYLAHKHDLEGALPGDHPYKVSPP